MAQVRLRKALQIKNRLAGEVAQLSKLIAQHNSHQDGSSRFDVAKLISDRESVVRKLVSVKTELAKANTAIYEKIALIAEYKAEIQMYRSLNTNEGTASAGYGVEAKVIRVVATVNAAMVEDKVREITLKIEKLQDEIDYFNSTTEIVLAD
jgi:hypothetical protein